MNTKVTVYILKVLSITVAATGATGRNRYLFTCCTSGSSIVEIHLSIFRNQCVVMLPGQDEAVRLKLNREDLLQSKCWNVTFLYFPFMAPSSVLILVLWWVTCQTSCCEELENLKTIQQGRVWNVVDLELNPSRPPSLLPSIFRLAFTTQQL